MTPNIRNRGTRQVEEKKIPEPTPPQQKKMLNSDDIMKRKERIKMRQI